MHIHWNKFKCNYITTQCGVITRTQRQSILEYILHSIHPPPLLTLTLPHIIGSATSALIALRMARRLATLIIIMSLLDVTCNRRRSPCVVAPPKETRASSSPRYLLRNSKGDDKCYCNATPIWKTKEITTKEITASLPCHTGRGGDYDNI